MRPEKSLKLTFDWFKIFYQNRENEKKIINFTIDQFKNFHKLIKYY